VVSVDEPRRLVMRWRTPSGDMVMTWLVEPGRGGSLLRVSQSSVLGPGRPHDSTFVGSPAAYQALFDDHLRGTLRSGLLARVQPPPRGGRPASLFEPARQVEPESSPVATFDAVRPGRRPWEPKPHRGPARRWPPSLVMAASTGVALAIVIAAWALASTGTLSSWGAPGPQGRPIAVDDSPSGDAAGPSSSGGPGGPATSGTGNGQPGTGQGGSPTPDPVTTEPSVAVAPTTAPGAPPAIQLTVAVVRTLVGFTATATVRNPAGVEQSWQSANVTLSLLNLTLSVPDSNVDYSQNGMDVCFTPTAEAATLAPNATVTFHFSATSVLGGVTDYALNAC
jgi:hypothetical protein